MVAGRPSHQSPPGMQQRPGQGVGLRRPTSGGRQVDHIHLTLEKFRELPEATEEDRAGYPMRPYLPDRRQFKDPRQRPDKEVARRASKDRARFHPQGSGVAQPHGGLVASFPPTGLSPDSAFRIATRSTKRRESPPGS